MKCRNCGAPIKDHVKFCPRCGQKQIDEDLDKTSPIDIHSYNTSETDGFKQIPNHHYDDFCDDSDYTEEENYLSYNFQSHTYPENEYENYTDYEEYAADEDFSEDENNFSDNFKKNKSVNKDIKNLKRAVFILAAILLVCGCALSYSFGINKGRDTADTAANTVKTENTNEAEKTDNKENSTEEKQEEKENDKDKNDDGMKNVEEGTYRFKNLNSGLYLDVTGGQAENRANVQQWGGDANPAPQQTWTLKYEGQGYYKIYSSVGDGSFLLDIYYGKSDNGTNIQIHNDTQSDAQLFKFIPDSYGNFNICTKSSGDRGCIDVEGQYTDNGVNVQVWEINGQTNQSWILEKCS